MQNRNMFLYRRQGPNKKRAKPGPSRKNRGPQKGLPNSARDLLPMIQPATKALAQMLAGRTGASGQLGHARAVLAHTERLVSDRAHNRLNPAEREEFFEQIARLKLTLADAESEAEVQAMEDDVPPPAPTTVDRERLKEMAMALTSSAGRSPREAEEAAEIVEPDVDAESVESEDPTEDRESEPVAASVNKPADDPNQLRLPRSSAESVTIQPDAARPRTNGRRRTAKSDGPSTPAKLPAKLKATVKPEPEPVSTLNVDPNEKLKVDQPARRATSTQKLPKGWIIDEEGFVVPGPAA